MRPVVPYFFLFFSFISIIADGPHHYHPACGHKGSFHLSPVHALQFFLSRCKFSTLTTRQPMVEFHLLAFPRFPLRKKEHKSYFGKNRTHDFRTSRCAAYPLDHSGDEQLLTGNILKARSAGGVSGSLLGRSVLKPKLFVAGLSFVSSPTLLHKFQVISKFPNFRRNTTISNRCPPKLQRRSINRSLV